MNLFKFRRKHRVYKVTDVSDMSNQTIRNSRSSLLWICKNYAEYTSVHAIPNILHVRQLKYRIFWSVVFVICFVAFAAQLEYLVSKYFKFEKHVEPTVKLLCYYYYYFSCFLAFSDFIIILKNK